MAYETKCLLLLLMMAAAAPTLAEESSHSEDNHPIPAPQRVEDTTCDLSYCEVYVPNSNCQNLIVGGASESNAPGDYYFVLDYKNVDYVHGTRCPDDNGGVNDGWTICGQQSSSYGPNMHIPLQVFDVRTSKQVATLTVKAQQNFCGLEAGDITFKILDDDQGWSLVFHKKGGSWSAGHPGKICICDAIPPE